MDEMQARIIADRIAARIQQWIINALSDDPVAQRVEAQRIDSGVSAECPFDSEAAPASHAPSSGSDGLAPERLIPPDWMVDLQELFGVAGVSSCVLHQIGLCVRRFGMAATNYAIGQAIRAEQVRGSRAIKWIWKVAEGWTPDQAAECRPTAKQVTLRADAKRAMFEEEAEGVL